MILPDKEKDFLKKVLDTIDMCRVTADIRAMQARTLKQWQFTGTPDGESAIFNFIGLHIKRMAGYLYSPTDLRFQMEFENIYDKTVQSQGNMCARMITRMFERRNIDTEFGDGVEMALTYGAAIPKLKWQYGGAGMDMVSPWQFGVIREDKNDLVDQEAVCETSYITLHDLWRRVSHRSDAASIMKRAKAYASRRNVADDDSSYFHQVLLAGGAPLINTEPPYTGGPGGVVNVSSQPVGAILAPEVAVEMVAVHELWVVDDALGDYTTIMLVEPDIFLTNPNRRRNLYVPGYLPYGLIQPNKQKGYFWGTSEVSQLMKLQLLLRDRLEDIKKLMALQYDRVLSFTGFSGMNDERYDHMKEAGWIAEDMAGARIDDLTPQLPPAAFEDVKEIIDFMQQVAGFDNVLQGGGEPGVRAGNHAQMLLKTAAPRMRNTALRVERQCADLGDKLFELIAAKQGDLSWTGPNPGDTFIPALIPEDRRIVVDGHSTSPIYEDDHRELAAYLFKNQIIDGESLLNMMQVTMRDTLIEKYREAQAAKAQMIKEHPELLEQGHKGGSHKK